MRRDQASTPPNPESEMAAKAMKSSDSDGPGCGDETCLGDSAGCTLGGGLSDESFIYFL
jgi:hypothetical protein